MTEEKVIDMQKFGRLLTAKLIDEIVETTEHVQSLMELLEEAEAYGLTSEMTQEHLNFLKSTLKLLITQLNLTQVKILKKFAHQ